jgi:Uma2 family endonuclease
MIATTPILRRKKERETYQQALLSALPTQGEWKEEDYLWLTDRTNRLIEFTDGRIEVLPMPTEKHQAISRYLFLQLLAFLQAIGGTVFYAPLRIKIGPRRFREPDLLLVRDAKDPRRGNAFWTGADLVVEIVSPDNPQRDTRKKRREYAQAGIPEYWIVNPLTATITVLRLEGAKYKEHGVFKRGVSATSAVLAGFAVSVDATLDAE